MDVTSRSTKFPCSKHAESRLSSDEGKINKEDSKAQAYEIIMNVY